MATAAPSPLASSLEKTNGHKLSRLLVDGGTTVLRNHFDHYHPPANLAANLHANLSILRGLKHRKILNDSQWDKLFPPGGGPPDSNTFDITLVFLLLTNICGLSTPLSGVWHKMPPTSDTTLAANLARIKCYRNELYGHVTTTGIQTPVFNVKWQEVSSVLVSLGLSQSEVDRLKREPCGEDYVRAVTEWMKDDEEILFQLRDIRQKQDQVLQSQREEHRTRQHTQRTLSKVQNVQMEAAKLQQEDHRILEDVHQRITQQQIGNEALKGEKRRYKEVEDEALRKLAKLNSEREVLHHSKKYQEGTRISFFQNIKLWLEDPNSGNRVMVISGDAGMGKSVIAAVVCQRMQQAGRLSGSHFCQHSKTRFRNPRVMLQSLACQLCEVLPQYKKEIVQALSRNLGEDINNLEIGELFEFLFEEPLRSVHDPGKILLMVIDGLDESEYKGRNELLDVIADHFCKLPVWLRFLVTTRPEINIADHLKKFNPLQLEQENEENVKDIRLFLKTQLGNVIQSGYEEIIINELVRKAAGHILYAYLMVDFIKKKFSILAPEELSRTLPSGVSSVYQSYFERLEKELQIGEEQFLTFLSALAAAREPLPLDFVSMMLPSETKSLAGRRKVREAVRSISTLLPVQDGRIHFFHKSIKDWMTDKTAYGEHNFSVDEKQGHLILSQLCTDEINGVKEKGVHSSEFSDTAKYALQHGVHHMLESKEGTRASSNFQEIVKNYVIDVEVMYAKLCVNDTATSKDIVRVQKQELFRALSSEIQGALGTLLFLFRKYHEILSTRPSVFFQVMANRGGDLFAAKATELLQTKYHEIPYMKYMYVDQQDEKVEMTGTQAVFRCMSQVTCFDISPQQEFMVCECKDGSIQLWSLQTGKLLWKRPVKGQKCYVDYRHTFRVVSHSPVFSCYRSVVFHPTEPLVLPGILSRAYTFDGDLLPLFPESNCRFSVCSVFGDNMITDSPDDAKCLVMWNLKNGKEIAQTIRNEVVLSFAWSPDGKLLAISHFSGLVCLVNALDCFKELAQVTISYPCGMIKFVVKSNIQFLFGWYRPVEQTFDGDWKSSPLNVIFKLRSGTFSLNDKSGFLMGDPIPCLFHSLKTVVAPPFWNLEKGSFAFVLNKQSVVRVFPESSNITLRSPELEDTRSATMAGFWMHCHIVFAVDGKTVYGVTEKMNGTTVESFNFSNGELKVGTRRDFRTMPTFVIGVFLVPVTKGVVLKRRIGVLEVQLWNFELSQIVRSWPSLCKVTYIMPFSDQCVACVGRGFEVSILDTSSGDIVKTIPLCHEGYESTYRSFKKEAIVCNKKYQVLSTARDSVQLSDGKGALWKRDLIDSLLYSSHLTGMFSPKEEFVLISVRASQRQEILVLDSSSGKTLRTLCTVDHVFNCAFSSNTECVIGCQNNSESFFLRLFNVRTGDLLSFLDMDSRPSCLASFPQKGLIAIGLCHSKRMCAFIEVKVQRDKVKREAKDFNCTKMMMDE